MADKRYKKVEPKDPNAGLKLLRDGLAEALQTIPTSDNSAVVTELSMLRTAVENMVDQQRASQEASRAQSELVANAIASIELNVSQSPSEPVDVQPIVEALGKLTPAPQQVQEVPQIDVEGLVEKIFNLTNKETTVPTYDFQIERNASGVLVGIKAIPMN